MKRLSLISLAACGLIIAGCGGGGGSSAIPPNAGNIGAAATPTPGSGASQGQATVSFTIRVSSSSSTSSTSRKNPQFVSSGTQSLGIVVTNQGASPSPAQYVNVSTCPTAGGVVTCQATVAANPGSDKFAISSYSAANGGGSLLGSGSITYQVAAGKNNVTSPLTLNGQVASLTVTPQLANLPLGQSTLLAITAKDATGAIIVGTFNNAPIAFSGANLSFSSGSISSSTDAANGVYVSWANGYNNWSAATLTATTSDNVTGTAKITPTTGMALYTAAGTATNNVGGIRMTLGPDKKLYWASTGALTCNSSGFCQTANGNLHRFDPTTLTDTAIDAGSEPVNLTFDANGNLWFGGGAAAVVGYLPNATTNFSAANLKLIPLASPQPNVTFNVRQVALDGTNAWIVVRGNTSSLYELPMTNPSAANLTSVQIPAGPAGTTNGNSAEGANVFYQNGVVYLTDDNNGVVDAYTVAAQTWNQYLIPGQVAANQYQYAYPYASAQAGADLYIDDMGPASLYQASGSGTISQFLTANNTWGPTYQPPTSIASEPAVYDANASYVAWGDYFTTGLGYVNVATGSVRSYPIAQAYVASAIFSAGAALASDGTQWFTCDNSGITPVPPLCIGHTVYVNGWSIWPSSQIFVNGAGQQAEQLVGIMEAPNANSGAFTAVSSNTNVCATSAVQDHNFNIVGVAAGACSVVVTDAHNVSHTISVTVTTTTGTISSKKHKNGGLF